ncbi:unnamed protein product [Bursaphelenchus okinawaensis]|uniref:N-acetyltransferase domain-containing protein n=1 Tax=Bursaphelenchus okinawaensis TaxID=465554 RepID=A0A811L8C8_9BILA|nr:unnamed protein product [Bursaphelenchus okinawaensis]CAG9119073.1 unnamed protein product [Bursaphelenchus okinawaensis]
MLLKYTLDPTLKRTKLGEKDTKAGLLETFILRNEDWPIVLQFLVNEFGTQEPINHAFSLNPTDLIAGFQDQIINKWSSSEASIVVLRDNQLAAVIINWIVNIDQQKEYQPAVIRQDYSEIIKALRLEVDDYTTNFPIVGAVIDDLEQAVPYYIPDSDKFMRIDIVNVVKEFQGLGLARYLWSLALKMAKDLEVSYVESICTAVATQKIARSAGFTPVFALPYGELKENGNNLLPRTLVDGSDSAHIMVKNLNQSENIRPS